MLTAVQPGSRSETAQRMRDELAAMRALAARTRKPSRRSRANSRHRWVIEAFNLQLDPRGIDALERPASAVPGARQRPADPALTLDGIDEPFPTPQRRTPASVARMTPHPVEPSSNAPPADAQTKPTSRVRASSR